MYIFYIPLHSDVQSVHRCSHVPMKQFASNLFRLQAPPTDQRSFPPTSSSAAATAQPRPGSLGQDLAFTNAFYFSKILFFFNCLIQCCLLLFIAFWYLGLFFFHPSTAFLFSRFHAFDLLFLYCVSASHPQPGSFPPSQSSSRSHRLYFRCFRSILYPGHFVT